MKRLPNSELEIMMIIWELNKPATRFEIEERMDKERKLSPTTVLSFLSRQYFRKSKIISFIQICNKLTSSTFYNIKM